MSLTLSDRDVAALTALQETLLSPLAHPSAYAWQTAIAESLVRFFRADRSICTIPEESGAVRQASYGIEANMAALLSSVLGGTRPGSIQFSDPTLDQLFFRMASARIDVWNHDLVRRVTGMWLEGSPFYHEIAIPAGAERPHMTSVSLPRGQGLLGFAYDRGTRKPFGDGTLDLCRLLQPAFRTGLWTVLSVGARRTALETLLEECAVGILVNDRDGVEIHRNRSLERTLAADPERSLILAAAEILSRALVASRREAKSVPDPAPAMARRAEVKTAVGSYSLGASYLAPGVFARDWTIAVTVAGRHPPLPGLDELQERLGLTRREAEVALHLAGGASDREIAARLGVSPHTARKHAEHVFDKLAVHSRKAFRSALIDAVARASGR